MRKKYRSSAASAVERSEAALAESERAHEAYLTRWMRIDSRRCTTASFRSETTSTAFLAAAPSSRQERRERMISKFPRRADLEERERRRQLRARKERRRDEDGT